MTKRRMQQYTPAVVVFGGGLVLSLILFGVLRGLEYLTLESKLHQAVEDRSMVSWAVLMIGLLCTVLTGGYLLRAGHRAARIEQLIVKRTSELRKTNEQLQSEIAERQRAEHARRSSELRYLELFEGAPDPILILDREGRVASINPAAGQLFADQPADVVGKFLDHVGVSGVSSPSHVLGELQLVAEGQQRPPIELEVVGNDHTRLTLEANMRGIVQEGQVVGVQVICRDVTERKRLERQWQEQARALELFNAQLAQREHVMHSLLEDLESSKARLEEQSQLLRSSNKRLESMAALKDEFVAKVSHELRTPLTSIKEGLSLLRDNALGATTPDQQDFLQTMDGDIDRLTELINNMLDISKIEAGRMRLFRTRVELQGFLIPFVRSYKPLLGRRTVTIDCPPEIPPVFIDRNRMVQVLTNLFSNALKMTPEDGTIVFRVSLRDGMVAIEVQDSGPGIAPEDVPKLFQKFSQVGPQGGRWVRGTGLGLLVCKELTTLHGGRIDVTSEVGRGATFTVLLPPYTDAFALRESLRELLELMPNSEGETACLLVVQATPVLDASAGDDERRERLGRLATEIKGRLHRGDIVLTVDPSWIAVLVLVHPQDSQSIIKRLREMIPGGPRLRFGVAAYPQDGEDAMTLFERATSGAA